MDVYLIVLKTRVNHPIFVKTANSQMIFVARGLSFHRPIRRLCFFVKCVAVKHSTQRYEKLETLLIDDFNPARNLHLPSGYVKIAIENGH